jgi:hypothetical protein
MGKYIIIKNSYLDYKLNQQFIPEAGGLKVEEEKK